MLTYLHIEHRFLHHTIKKCHKREECRKKKKRGQKKTKTQNKYHKYNLGLSCRVHYLVSG